MQTRIVSESFLRNLDLPENDEVICINNVSNQIVLEKIGKEKEVETLMKIQKYFSHFMGNQEKYDLPQFNN